MAPWAATTCSETPRAACSTWHEKITVPSSAWFREMLQENHLVMYEPALEGIRDTQPDFLNYSWTMAKKWYKCQTPMKIS